MKNLLWTITVTSAAAVITGGLLAYARAVDNGPNKLALLTAETELETQLDRAIVSQLFRVRQGLIEGQLSP